MVKRLSAMKARQTFGHVMNEVSLNGDDYIVERAGKPLVAIISLEKYLTLQKERDDAVKALENVWERMKGEKPEAGKNALDDWDNPGRRLS